MWVCPKSQRARSQNSPKDLDPSYKMNLDFGLFLKGKNKIISKKYSMLFCGELRRNMVFTVRVLVYLEIFIVECDMVPSLQLCAVYICIYM